MPIVRHEIEISDGLTTIILDMKSKCELTIRMIDTKTNKIIDRKQLVDDFDNQIKFA